ncbi:MAG TPA: EpsI family protein [Steroidobacteraceae bacterium]|jgi:EpsI family protein
MRSNAIRLGSVLLLVAALYWPDTLALGRYWAHEDTNARAGVLIAVLSAFLLFRARGRLEQISFAPAPWAGLPLIACAAASLICWRAGILTLQLLFLPPILWLAVLCALGWQAARAGAFAIGFLYFALPGWDVLRPALQHLTAQAVRFIGPLFGLPVVISGMTAYLPGGATFTIERACSGADFLAVGLAVAMLHGELEQAPLRRRAGLIGSMALLAILSNWLRVLLILAIGYLTHMRSALATRDHVALGWVVFACVLLLFAWLAGGSTRAVADAPAVEQFRGASGQGFAQGRATVWRYCMAAVALAAVPAIVYGSLLATAVRVSAAAFELPPVRAPWQGPQDSVDPLWQPEFVGADAERRGLYRSADGRVVEVVAIGFQRQTQGAQILNGGNSLLGARGLTMETVALVDAGIPHSEIVTRDAHGRRSLIWSVIDVGGRLFGEPLFSQLWYGARSLGGAPYSALFALKTPCGISCAAARGVLAGFLRANGPALFASVPHSRLAPARPDSRAAGPEM